MAYGGVDRPCSTRNGALSSGVESGSCSRSGGPRHPCGRPRAVLSHAVRPYAAVTVEHCDCPEGSKRGRWMSTVRTLFWGCDCIGVPVFDGVGFMRKETVDAALICEVHERIRRMLTRVCAVDRHGWGRRTAARLLPDYGERQ